MEFVTLMNDISKYIRYLGQSIDANTNYVLQFDKNYKIK